MTSLEMLRRVGCGVTGAVIGLAQSLGLHLANSNLANIQGALGATAAEASWLTTAYFAAALSSTLLLVKIRLHVGLSRFATVGLCVFLGAAALHLAANSVSSAVMVRAMLGTVSPVMSTLAVLYLIEAFAPRFQVVGLLLGFCFLQLGMPLSRVMSPSLLELGQWHGLFLIDVALALLSLAAIHLIRLPAPPPQASWTRGDFVAFPLYAGGLALLSVAVSQGRLYWWTDTDWIGQCLAASIVLVGLYVLFDLNRAQPLIDLRWLVRPFMIQFVVAVLFFRIVLAEQSVGIVGLMTVLGQSNEQMGTLFSIVTAATFLGFIACIGIAARRGPRVLGLLALVLVISGSLFDATATALTRPEQLYVSQAILSAGLAAFFSGAVLLGFGPVMAEGGKNLVSFLAAFTLAQYLGSLLGSAWVSTTVAQRQTVQYSALAQHIQYGDPQVSTRLAQLAGSVARVVSDPAERTRQGAALLAQQVTRESMVLAYNDLFQRIAAIGVVMFIVLGALTWRAHQKDRRRDQDAAGDPSRAQAGAPAGAPVGAQSSAQVGTPAALRPAP
ncbi:MFS transporter [Roseateles depolymerans]|uniref:Multidrug resistance protein B n=1 Tax=Roseateles depolymerans TaxID=76731 RepID=A0A0U2U5N7_9BURK|nr:MFS transporter [Roseateles depolymerans]ALV07345.1 Multidrug resistance protein B [Roseateles depolymerans]REG22445.1 MFS transporter [Roseateles depolymerans]